MKQDNNSQRILGMFKISRASFSIICISALLIISSSVFGQSHLTGRISGVLVDAETGDPLIGANIYLDGTTIGAGTDLDGSYVILNVPEGTYTLVVSMLSYAETKVTGVKVKSNETTQISISVKPEVLTGETVTVEARVVENTEALLLKKRQRSNSVSDAISAEAISRSGSGDAAEAMKQVTGASVVDGKYVYVRGLGDRYTSTQLNGAELPSTDPYRRAGSIDMIPSNLIDNIQTIKSFTPDKPGDFSGGAVDINTKDFPNKLNFSVSTSRSYNSQSTLNSNGLSYTGGKTDWLGMDDGTRNIPDMLKSKDVYIPSISETSSDPEKAKLLTDMTKGFTKDFGPTKWTPPLNQSYSFSLGNQASILNRPLGYLASFSYSRSNSSYQDAAYQRWVLGSSNVMAQTYDFKDSQTKDEVLWSGLFKASYKFSPDHMVSFNGMYNQNGVSEARFLQGRYPYDSEENDVYRTRVISYKERTLRTVQLDGKNMFRNLFNMKLTWNAFLGNTSENEPDRRYFTDKYRLVEGQKQYFIKSDVSPSRYYRDLSENRKDFSTDLNIPFKQWSGLAANFKIGILAANKDRDYSERIFNFYLNKFGSGDYIYNGNPNDLLSPENIGIIDTLAVTIHGVTYYTPVWGVVVTEKTLPNNVYHANQSISANYAMVEIPLLNSLKFVGGARYETTDMKVTNEAQNSGFETHDWLPSANLIYNIINNMNVRLALSKTLARPTFREMSQFVTEDFIIGEIFIGNADLKRTLIKNYDFRWEWFMRPGELYAMSLFYKDFDQPIERVYNGSGENSWTNIDKAKAYGIELEFRKRLDLIHKSLGNFLLGSNVSLIHSEHRITDEEWFFIKQYRPNADRTRPFQGESPYLVNVNLTYENPRMGLVSSIYYNIFGKRLDRVSYAATPDVYEKPAGLLNFSTKWSFMEHFDLKFVANNLLNPEFTKYHSFKGKDYIYWQYKKGVSFSLGLGYNL